MKNLIAAAFAVCFVLAPLGAEPPELSTYEKNFIRAGLADKAEVLSDAVTDPAASRFASALYEFALDYAVRYAELFGGEPDMLDIVVRAANGLKQYGRAESAPILWRAFNGYDDPLSRVAVLESLSVCAAGKADIIDGIEAYAASDSPDTQTQLAAVRTLGALRDPSSFPALFHVMTSASSRDLRQEAAAAAKGLPGVAESVLEIIRNGKPAEKLAAFGFVRGSDALDADSQEKIAETALESALAQSGSADADELRYQAVETLTVLGRQSASPLLIQNFYRVQLDYQNGTASRDRFIEAIASLGAAGTTEAAQALVLQLGYFNAQQERHGANDEASVLALIRALGVIGDKAAFDYLLYMSYLSYTDTIQVAAREALTKLQW